MPLLFKYLQNIKLLFCRYISFWSDLFSSIIATNYRTVKNSFSQYFERNEISGSQSVVKRKDRIVITKYKLAAAFTIKTTRNIELIETSVECNWGAFCYERADAQKISFAISYARFIIDLPLVDHKKEIWMKVSNEIWLNR